MKDVMYDILSWGVILAVLVLATGCSKENYNYSQKIQVCEDGNLYEVIKHQSKILIGEC